MCNLKLLIEGTIITCNRNFTILCKQDEKGQSLNNLINVSRLYKIRRFSNRRSDNFPITVDCK